MLSLPPLLTAIYFNTSAIIGQIKGKLILKHRKTSPPDVHKHFESISASY